MKSKGKNRRLVTLLAKGYLGFTLALVLIFFFVSWLNEAYFDWLSRMPDVESLARDRNMQAGKYDASRGTFRTFLATMIRNHLISLYRKDRSRGAGLHVDIDDVDPDVPADVAEQIDAKWRLARHQSAIEHVLTKTAMTARYRIHASRFLCAPHTPFR